MSKRTIRTIRSVVNQAADVLKVELGPENSDFSHIQYDSSKAGLADGAVFEVRDRTFPNENIANSANAIKRYFKGGAWIWCELPNPAYLFKTFQRSRISAYCESFRISGFENQIVFGFRDGETLIPLGGVRNFDLVPSRLGIENKWKRLLVQNRLTIGFVLPHLAIFAYPSSKSLAPWLRDIHNCMDLMFLQTGQCSCSYYDGHVRFIRQVPFSRLRRGRFKRLQKVVDEIPEADKESLGVRNWKWSGGDEAFWLDRPYLSGKRVEKCELFAPNVFSKIIDRLADVMRISPRPGCLHLTLQETFGTYLNLQPSSLIKSVTLQRLQALTQSISRRVATYPVFQHGDLTTNNILLDREQIHFIDWEWSCWTNIPGFDLLDLTQVKARSRNIGIEFWKPLLSSAFDHNPNNEYTEMFKKVYPGAIWSDAVLGFWILRMARNLWHGDAWAEKVLIPTMDFVESKLIAA